ncbi:MAG TPA: peroxiredoxin [Gammaproteobacteria bacterium]|nr:peroxiredoxin [Gammaproteobacteria bacterium]
MQKVMLNHVVPDFSLPSTDGNELALSSLLGKNIVLYFYPKDCTSGCTLEGQNFRDNIEKFKKLNAVILGVSRDDLKLHHKFKTEQSFPFELLSDAEEKACKLFAVIKEKNMYGKKVMGIERSTFLIDQHGKLVHEWRGVKVDGHVEEVLAKLKEFV